MIIYSKYIRWKRKINFLSLPSLLLLLCSLIFLIYYIEFLLSPWKRKVKAHVEELSPLETQLSEAHQKIALLTSVLKQHQVPEKEYLHEDIPTIYIVTATYSRPAQKAELTRLKNVFLHVHSIHWIVVEDASGPSRLVSKFLQSCNIPFTHLHKETPSEWKLKHKDPRWSKPRGVLQRNEAITWLRENVREPSDDVVYFADDDNTYSMELFEEMRFTKTVSVWPVGLVGGVMVERPLLNFRGRVNNFMVGWKPERAFPMDMAGFAVNVGLLLRTPDAYFSHRSKIGYLESDFLEKIVTREELEPKSNGCTKVFVWHTQTKDPKLSDEQRLRAQGKASDVGIEV